MEKKNNGAAWRKSINTKYGQVEVISATIDGKRYTLWPNKSKKEPKHPDYNVVEDTFVPKGNGQVSSENRNYSVNDPVKVHTTDSRDMTSNDLPF